MPLLRPTLYLHHITDLTAESVCARGIRLLVLDIDNTLTPHNHPMPAAGVTDWIDRMQRAGLTLAILSNNTTARAQPFAERLGLPFAAAGGKPLTIGLSKLRRRFGCSRRETALIGDQLFTDMLCGNLGGVISILVEPYEPEQHGFLALKRQWERPFLQRYREELR